jgi:hypothetical protein
MVKILLILLLPSLCLADTYNDAVMKIGEVLYNQSREKEDLDEGFRYVKQQAPEYVVRPLEILIPTLMAIREQKFELRYRHEF